MSDTIIKVENLSKQYRLGKIGTGSFSHDLNRWFHKIRGNEDPYLKIAEVNDRASKGNSNYVWSLRDINFEVKKGDAIGIIGRNGAGKSTLLKILSRTTSPTIGSIKIKGRVASLLEVGTGFHPELSGRENIFLNGAILGMTKQEIKKKFDEIVDFAGVERYVDTPVKRYSSGMYVRLAFGVAAHLEPEILIVDEILAVGDSEFQKKALGKMNDVSKGEGRTILFVSHNMGAIAQLCTKSIVLNQGRIEYQGQVKPGIDHYLQVNGRENSFFYKNLAPKLSDILSINVLKENGEPSFNFRFDENIIMQFTIQVENKYVNAATIGFRIVDKSSRNVFTSETKLSGIISNEGFHTIKVIIPKSFLVPSTYMPVVALHVPNVRLIAFLEAPVQFEIEETGTDFFKYAGNDYGCVFIDCKWNVVM